MQRANLWLPVLMGMGLAAWLTGCTAKKSADSKVDVTAHRAKFALSTEPEGSIGVKAARELLIAQKGPAAVAKAESATGDTSTGAPSTGAPSTGDGEKATPANPAEAAQPDDTAKPADKAEPKDDHPAAAHAEHDHDHADHKHDGHDHAHGDHNHAGHDHGDHKHDEAYSSASGGKEIVVVGKIGGIDDPWEKGRARFMIADLAAAEHDHSHEGHDHAHEGHDHAHHDHEEGHTCLFCERAKPGTDSLAIVEFTDSRGKLLPIDARDLFDLSKSQTVIIRGRAHLGPADSLVISADGLYVRPDRK